MRQINTVIRKCSKAVALPVGLGARKNPQDAVVLLYHKVGSGDREIDISMGAFARQLEHLDEHERVGTLDDCLSRGGVAITIDDGFRDFCDNVVPAAVDNGVPVLLYLATGNVAENGKRASEALSWSDLRDAVATGLVQVGAHTHTHANLADATEAEAEDEMARSKGMIEDELGMECRHFSYPWSLASPAAERVARRLFATAALPWATNRARTIDPHRVGRTPVLKSDGPMFFKAKVAGMLDGEALVYRALRRGPWRPS
jgi:hypothetical protein